MNLRRRPRKDPVPATTRLDVFRRDGPCVGWWLDAEGSCDGRTTLDHVKDEQRMGVRAPSDMRHLVTVCAAHSEQGARAGRQWNTANRPLLRLYLEHVQHWPPLTAARMALAALGAPCGHVEPVAGCPGPCNGVRARSAATYSGLGRVLTPVSSEERGE